MAVRKGTDASILETDETVVFRNLPTAGHDFHGTEFPPVHGGDMRIFAENWLFKLFEPESDDVPRVKSGTQDRSTTCQSDRISPDSVIHLSRPPRKN
jgi:hypothetical protein